MNDEHHLPEQHKIRRELKPRWFLTEHTVHEGAQHIIFKELSPWSSPAGPLGSPSVSPGVVLSDPPLGVHGETNVDTTFEFGVCTVQHVHAKKTVNLYYHSKENPGTNVQRICVIGRLRFWWAKKTA